jgi:TRAP-type C4-dicarboxylate transport system substrate-binding protein
MPRKPKDVWNQLPKHIREQILDEMSEILTEVIHEKLRNGNTETSDTKSNNLH